MSSRLATACALVSPEWSALLAYCSRPPASRDGGIDSTKLLALAEAHGMVGQLAANLDLRQAEPGEALQNALRSAWREQVLATMPLVAELFRVLDVLTAAEIATVVVKGPVLAARAFGDASARRYGDIDFLVRSADMARAAGAMVAAGFAARIPAGAIGAQKIPGQYAFRRAGTGPLIELHTERTLRYFPRPVPIDDFLRRSTTVSIDGRPVPALAAEDEFVLISVHGAKHFWERLIWIADVAAMVRGRPELDWKRVQRSAADVGAGRMVHVALLLAERLLLAPVPAELKQAVASDAPSGKMVRKIESWLPYAGTEPPPLMERALFRFRMRGHMLAGAGYLTRLSLSPTEDDWSREAKPADGWRASLGRPLRLARKYRRNPKKRGT